METKTPANDEAGTNETSDARNNIRKAFMARIALLLAFPRCTLPPREALPVNGRHDLY
jgi:hypothetical protein